MLILCSFVPRSGEGKKLTAVVVLWSHYQSPRKRRVETELDIRAVQEGRACGTNIRGENSIVESSTGVVAVDVEVVVCRVVSASGLEMEEVLGRVASTENRVGRDGGDQQSEQREELHSEKTPMFCSDQLGAIVISILNR